MSSEIEKVEGGLFADDRGFLRFVNDFDFSQVKRFYQVENHAAGFIRAWHGHKKEKKFIYVPKGTALIGLVNMETEEVHKFTLSSQRPCVLCVPGGYANGFKTLEKDTIIMIWEESYR
ncbi:MAG: polysaccharide biosynthesis C-terminal domain-containing protein [Candidatus Thorarchaeota archaeon]|jgi:dTDP-4-dehydrorhamnose 3,5-epimerase